MREILSAGPITCLAGLARLGQKTAYFFDQVELRGTKPLIGRLLKISFGDVHIVIRLMGVNGLIVRRQLRRYQWSGRAGRLFSGGLRRLLLGSLFMGRRNWLGADGCDRQGRGRGRRRSGWRRFSATSGGVAVVSGATLVSGLESAGVWHGSRGDGRRRFDGFLLASGKRERQPASQQSD